MHTLAITSFYLSLITHSFIVCSSPVEVLKQKFCLIVDSKKLELTNKLNVNGIQDQKLIKNFNFTCLRTEDYQEITFLQLLIDQAGSREINYANLSLEIQDYLFQTHKIKFNNEFIGKMLKNASKELVEKYVRSGLNPHNHHGASLLYWFIMNYTDVSNTTLQESTINSELLNYLLKDLNIHPNAYEGRPSLIYWAVVSMDKGIDNKSGPVSFRAKAGEIIFQKLIHYHGFYPDSPIDYKTGETLLNFLIKIYHQSHNENKTQFFLNLISQLIASGANPNAKGSEGLDGIQLTQQLFPNETLFLSTNARKGYVLLNTLRNRTYFSFQN